MHALEGKRISIKHGTHTHSLKHWQALQHSECLKLEFLNTYNSISRDSHYCTLMYIRSTAGLDTAHNNSCKSASHNPKIVLFNKMNYWFMAVM